MKTTCAKFVVAGYLGWLSCTAGLRAQETPSTVLKTRPERFMYAADKGRRVFFTAYPKEDANADKARFPLTEFTFWAKLPSTLGTWEVPEFKAEYDGAKYVLPAQKIIVIEPPPKEQGMYARVEVDPNGTGAVEVLLTINWADWPDTQKNIEFLNNLLPKDVEVISNGAGWGHPNGGLTWSKSLVFRNRTGKPFILDQGYFENLPTNEGWPEIVIPPAN